MRVALLLVVAPWLAAESATAQAPFTELALSDTTLTAPTTYVESAAPADIDGDGDLDLLTAGPAGLVLYRNDSLDGDTLRLTRAVVPTGSLLWDSVDLAWGDYDGDGDPDAIAGMVGRDTTDFLGEMALFRNDSGTLVGTPTALPGYVEDRAFEMLDYRSLTWADLDNDGDLDLYVPASYGTDGSCCDATSVVLRNDGPGAGDAWTFTPTATPVPYGYNAVTAWADPDTDGDLDLFVADFGGLLAHAGTYRNDDGALTPDGPVLPQIVEGTADWGDGDGDGDLDVLVAGQLYENGTFTSYDVRIYVRDSTSYTPLVVVSEAQEPEWVSFRAASWADYDSDGDVDVLLAGVAVVVDTTTGFPAFAGRAHVYANNGTGTFALAARLPGPSEPQYGGTVQWFDVDGDGDLDYFITGAYEIPGPTGNEFEFRTQLFRNEAPALNAPPSAPGGLAATTTADGATLVWQAATDDHTPVPSLTYNLRVTTLDGQDIVSPHARTGGGRLVPEPGNVSHDLHWALRDLAPGQYTWSVQAVDNAFNGGPFADGGTFTVGSVGTGTGADEALAVLMLAPNPTAGPAEAALTLPRAARATVVVYDALGREVAVLADANLAAGRHAWPLGMARLAPGVYTVRAQVEGGAPPLIARLTVVR